MIELKKKYFRGGALHKMIWMEDGEIHRPDFPAYITFHMNGLLHLHAWYHHGKPHRLSGPAAMYYSGLSNLVSYEWFINGNIIESPSDGWPLTIEQQVELKLKHG